MPQKKKRKLQASDFFIVFVCLGVCFVSLWFFWKDLNSSTTRSDVDKIAEISFKRNVAQRKFSDRVVWERLQQNSPLYDSDTIRTSDGAEAKIIFNDGTVVEITENTMIQVSLATDGSVNLVVDGGNIAVDTTATSGNSSVSLSVGDGSLVKLDSGSKLVATASSENQSSSISVQTGNAVVSGTDGEVQSLKKGESVSVEENGEIKKQSVTVTSIAKNLRVFKVEEKAEPVKIEWQSAQDSSEEEKTVRVETFKDKDFTQMISSFTAQGSSSVEIEPTEEKIYWRVYADGEEDKAVEGRIQVVDIQKTVLSSPVNNSVFKYRKEYPLLRFNWEQNDYADFYRIEISSTADFSQVLLSEDVSQTSFSTSSIGKGNYYWKVTPHYAVNNIGFLSSSDSYKFTLEEKTAATPPVLMLPSSDAKITLSAVEQNVSFAWKSDVKEADYSVLISSSDDFENTVYDFKTSQVSFVQKFNIQTLPQGTYYWKILRRSDDDDEEVSSETRTFSVAAYVPGENRLVYPPDNYSVEQSALLKLPFTWKLASEFVQQNLSSVIQFSKNSDFSTIEKELESDSQQTTGMNLGFGTYYWRVAVKDDSGISGFSSARTLNVIRELGGVSFVSPSSSSKTVIGENEEILISWTKASGADYYRCSVTDADGKIAYKNEKLFEPSVRVALPDVSSSWKTYKVSVTPYTEETDYVSAREGDVSSIVFEVRNPESVKLVSPLNNASYAGLAALKNPVVLSWAAGDTPVRSNLILQKQNSDGSWRTVQNIANPSTSVSIERLNEGRYRWTVTASSSQGLPLDSKEYGTFTVLPIPLLPAAVLNTPLRNQKIDGQYLRKNRSITFSWQNVSGATDYEFVLYQVRSDGTYRNIYSQSMMKQTEVKIRDLSIFDVGTFEWRVVAYSHAKDGFEEQKGSISSSRFVIDFALPNKVETVTPGTMYGE